MTRETRIVSFVVVSEVLDHGALGAALGESDVAHRPRQRFPNQASWELRVSGASDADLGSMIDDILTRVAPLGESIARLRSEDPDLACKLQIVGYLEPGHTEPGFAIDREQVQLLAKLGAFVDADLYVDV